MSAGSPSTGPSPEDGSARRGPGNPGSPGARAVPQCGHDRPQGRRRRR
jgi:hypothetical protein